MSEIYFLDLNDILTIHQSTIDQEGGSQGIRDVALVESAISAPMATFGGEFLNPDLASMTSALMFSLIGNHGFVDGNKRVGTLAAMVFLDNNGVETLPGAAELEEAALAVAQGKIRKDELVGWWRQRLPG